MNEDPVDDQTDLDLPPFLIRGTAEAEPTFEQIEAVIAQLSAKQAAIEEKKQALKDQLHKRIEAL